MKRLLLLLLVFAAPSFGQGTLEVIPLRHRTADQVIPILRPLLEPGGRVVQESTVIQDASTGFEVVPRLSGGTGSSSSRSESGILSSRDRSAAGDRRIWVKVEEIR